ncbi:hypothetical protein [Acinetobacter lactucae]|uniref:HNH endonuclease n=1 Tax=Acinetobacter lactucae TaxID=1785128 RepID=R8YUG2_9GAMM|nr:hypothetical protein [Acinetobacter lactucae]EOQ73055.1 hypothetical protein F929_02990 [Acinetobacter lactucae]
MTIGICKLCGEEKELQRSHVIGKTFFSSILRDSYKNVATQFEFRNNTVIQTNDTWYTRLLCSNCERFFNEEYENYSIAALRRKRKEIEINEEPDGVTFKNVDVEKIVLFIFSIYWRASHSDHEAFTECITFPELDKVLIGILKKKIKIDPKLLKVRMRLLKDSSNFFDEILIKQIIISPFRKDLSKGFMYTLVFEGYLFEIYFTTLNFQFGNKLGFLVNNNEAYVPYIEIFSHKDISETLFAGAKNLESQ